MLLSHLAVRTMLARLSVATQPIIVLLVQLGTSQSAVLPTTFSPSNTTLTASLAHLPQRATCHSPASPLIHTTTYTACDILAAAIAIAQPLFSVRCIRPDARCGAGGAYPELYPDPKDLSGGNVTRAIAGCSGADLWKFPIVKTPISHRTGEVQMGVREVGAAWNGTTDRGVDFIFFDSRTGDYCFIGSEGVGGRWLRCVEEWGL